MDNLADFLYNIALDLEKDQGWRSVTKTYLTGKDLKKDINESADLYNVERDSKTEMYLKNIRLPSTLRNLHQYIEPLAVSIKAEDWYQNMFHQHYMNIILADITTISEILNQSSTQQYLKYLHPYHQHQIHMDEKYQPLPRDLELMIMFCVSWDCRHGDWPIFQSTKKYIETEVLKLLRLSGSQ